MQSNQVSIKLNLEENRVKYMFELFFNDVTEDCPKMYNCYMGINKKEFPKWQGWKVIANYKEQGIDIKDIKSEVLDVLVYNFWYRYYLEYMI
jgi:hypothetical protein